MCFNHGDCQRISIARQQSRRTSVRIRAVYLPRTKNVTSRKFARIRRPDGPAGITITEDSLPVELTSLTDCVACIGLRPERSPTTPAFSPKQDFSCGTKIPGTGSC